MKSEYLPTIGIECHVQLRTKTKLFSGAGNDARWAEPNTLVNHIDFGLPGALPVFNREALHLATLAALALNIRPQLFSTFDRKHYFYPDLPMGYQITQYDQPIIIGGRVDFLDDGKHKSVGITRAHLESDAGKSTHPEGQNYSLVDLNRAGTPLLEIVSEPEMHSAQEAKAYAKELYLLMRYAGVTEGDLYHGNMRFDVNVSVSKSRELGTRSETKNLNSFRSVEKAVEYEIKRQIEIIESGKRVIQETRGWNEAKQKTVLQRTKENADDYRYMPDPDLPPIVIDDQVIDKFAADMLPTPAFWRKRLKELEVGGEMIELLIEAHAEYPDARYLDLLVAFSDDNLDAKMLANWLINSDIPLQREGKVKLGDRLSLYQDVEQLVKANLISSTNAKQLIVDILVLASPPVDLKQYAEQQGLLQQSDRSSLEVIVDSVISHNQKAVNDYKAGEQKALGFLIGQVMAASKGAANPTLAKEILQTKISK